MKQRRLPAGSGMGVIDRVDKVASAGINERLYYTFPVLQQRSGYAIQLWETVQGQ